MSNLRRNLSIAFACLIFLLLVLASRFWGSFFIIPTSGMEDTLPVDSYIYTFNTQQVQRNDIIVFRYPVEEGDIAQKTPYLKRLIGLPGDSIQVKEGKVYINAQAEKLPEKAQHSYKLFLKQGKKLNDRLIEYHELGPLIGAYDDYYNIYEGYTQLLLNQQEYQVLKQKTVVEKLELNLMVEETAGEVFPNDPDFAWTRDFFGPLWLPEAGVSIPLNEKNVILYGKTIQQYEGIEAPVKIQNRKLFIDGQVQDVYTFQQGYYFVMGDNRHNSLDSRYFGFVPQDHILGKMVWHIF